MLSGSQCRPILVQGFVVCVCVSVLHVIGNEIIILSLLLMLQPKPVKSSLVKLRISEQLKRRKFKH